MKRARKAGLIAGLAIAALLTFIRWIDPPPLRDLRAAGFDLYQQMHPRAAGEAPVVVVAIDEAALREAGQWPWPRHRMAELTVRLFDLGAAAVAFDILFSEPDRLAPARLARDAGITDAGLLAAIPDGDAAFAAALARGPAALAFTAAPGGGMPPAMKAGFAVTGEAVSGNLGRVSSAIAPLAPLANAAPGLGHISLGRDQVGSRVREVPLLLTDGEALYPSLLLEALRLAFQASTYVVKADPARAGSMQALRVGELEIPVNERGEFRFHAAADDPAAMLPALGLLQGHEPKAEDAARIAGAIVLVGVTAAGLHDIRATPLGEAVPGVAIQAQLLSQMLDGQFLHRPAWIEGVEVLAVALLSFLLVLISCYAAPFWGLAAAGAVAAGLLAAGWYLFVSAGFLLDPVLPLAAALLTVFGTTAFWYLVTDSDRRAIRSAFGKYVSPAVLARIEQSPEGLQLGGVNREITVLFMDVRGFTALSEKLAPDETVRLLNRLLDAMSAPVIAREGTLDKYMGDSIMAFWNAPLDVPDHARQAALAALEMMEALGQLNAADAFGLGPGKAIRAGIGINTGIACVGNMGTEERLSYSAIGDAVNTAARIEAACKDTGADILLSEATARRLAGFGLSQAGEFRLRGKSEPVAVYSLLSGPSSAS